jgi:hypothetical protein
MTEIEERLREIEKGWQHVFPTGLDSISAAKEDIGWLFSLVRSQQSELARFREHFKKIDTLSYECRCIPAQLICREAKVALTAAPGEKETE